MARCRECGMEMDFVMLPSGKAMPVSGEYIMVDRRSKRPNRTIITDEGETVRGREIARGHHLKNHKPDEYFVAGRESHFANCPGASRFRRK